MSATIKIKSGLKANLASSGVTLGEPKFATDTGELFIGNGTDNVPIGGGGSVVTVNTITDDATKVPSAKAIYQYIASGNAGKPRNLTSVDLDTILATGFYSCDTCTNRPSEHNGVMLVIQNNLNDNTFQFYATFNDNKVWYRHKYSSSWKEWKELGSLVDDVKVDGTSVVTDKVANIDLTGKVNKTDIVDDLESTATNKPLSANMGRELAEYVDDSITDTMTFIIQERDAEKAAREAGDDLRYTKTESDAKFSLISETGNKIDLECSTTDYKLVAKLYDKNNNLISTSTVIDLPIESLVMSVEYVDTTDHPKSIKITLQNGTITYVPVGAIVSGLASQTDLDAVSSRVTTIEGKEASWDAKAELSDITKSRVGLDNVDNTSDATKKTNFTGSIASGNTGFVTGGDVYTAIGNIETVLTTLTTGSGV